MLPINDKQITGIIKIIKEERKKEANRPAEYKNTLHYQLEVFRTDLNILWFKIIKMLKIKEMLDKIIGE